MSALDGHVEDIEEACLMLETSQPLAIAALQTADPACQNIARR
jgi:hypothetical protein